MSDQAKADRYWTCAMLAFVAIIVWHAAQPLFACPTCKDAIEQASNGGSGTVASADLETPGSGNLAKGFFWSVLTMLGVVYALLALGIVFIVRSIRKARVAVQTDAAVPGGLVSES